MVGTSLRLPLRLGIVHALASGATDSPAPTDDAGADQLLQRRDGAFDGLRAEHLRDSDVGEFVPLSQVDDRFVDAEGNQIRDCLEVHIDQTTGVRRERERISTRGQRGEGTELRIERFIDADGKVISETIRVACRGERADGREAATARCAPAERSRPRSISA